MPFEQGPFTEGPPAPPNVYTIGALVTLSASFSEVVGGAPLDPDDVFLDVTNPSNVTTTYEYGVDPEIVNDAEGEYHADISADAVGTWTYRWYSTGEGQAAKRKTFEVE